jgi:hypothetical protein
MIELIMETKLSKVTQQSRKIWNKGNYDSIRSELQTIDWETGFNGLSLDNSWLLFKNTMLQIAEKTCPCEKNACTVSGPVDNKGDKKIC